MCPTFLSDARFWSFLVRVDEEIAQEAREKRCPFCGEALHSAHYRRKPRAPGEIPPEARTRFSLSCSSDRCRRRTTPPSVRFLDRKIFLSAVVLIVTAMRQGPTRRGLRELKRLFAVSRRTIARWELWWADVFPNTAFWRGLRTRLRARSEAPSPGWLLRPITIHASPAVLSCLLRCLAGQWVATGSRGR